MTGRRVIAFGLRDLGFEGGIETHARELYSRLAPLGYEVTVLVRSRYGAVAREASAASVKPIWAPRGKGVEAFFHSLFCAGYCALARPDLVHVHGIGPAFFAAFLRAVGLRVVVTHHGHDYDAAKWGGFARWLLRTGERVGIGSADAVICVSESIRRSVEGPVPSRCHSIYNGALAAADASVAPEGPLAGLAAASYVLMVGRITGHKRIMDVIAAMDRPALRGLRLVVCGSTAGSDPEIGAVRAAARGNSRIVLAGYVDPRCLPWLYRNSACTVMASTYEGMPLAVLEALSSGAKVLLSHIDAHEELGLPAEHYFEARNVADLGAHLEHLVLDPEAAAFGPLQLDERFDWTHIARQTADVFDSVLCVPARRAALH